MNQGQNGENGALVSPNSKPLPEKPLLLDIDEPEEPESRGIMGMFSSTILFRWKKLTGVDAHDVNMKNVTFATLTPEVAVDISPSTSSNNIQSDVYLEAQDASPPSYIQHSASSSTLRSTPRPTDGPSPISSHTRTISNGSLTPRNIVRKANHPDLRNSVDLSQQFQLLAPPPISESLGRLPKQQRSNRSNNTSTPNRPIVAANKSVARAASFNSNGAPSPQLEPDDQVRRLSRYGVGLTMKVSVEANHAIYGKSPTNMGPNSRAITNRSPSGLGRNTRVHAKTRSKQIAQRELVLHLCGPDCNVPEPADERNAGKKNGAPHPSQECPFPLRKSSLPPSSNKSPKTTAPRKNRRPFGSRLARPTAASAAREIEGKKRIADVKAPRLSDQSEQSDKSTLVKRTSGGFRSRFTSFLPGLRRSSEQQRYNAVLENKPPSPPSVPRGPHTAYRDHAAEKYTGMSGTSPDVPLVHLEVPPSANTADELDRAKSRTGASTPNTSTSLQVHRHGPPDTPPRSRAGFAGLHSETGAPFDHDAVGEHMDRCVRDAETHLYRILEVSQGIEDRDRGNFIEIAECLGEAIQSVRDLRMAAIAAAASNAKLAMMTESLSRAAVTAVENFGCN